MRSRHFISIARTSSGWVLGAIALAVFGCQLRSTESTPSNERYSPGLSLKLESSTEDHMQVRLTWSPQPEGLVRIVRAESSDTRQNWSFVDVATVDGRSGTYVDEVAAPGRGSVKYMLKDDRGLSPLDGFEAQITKPLYCRIWSKSPKTDRNQRCDVAIFPEKVMTDGNPNFILRARELRASSGTTAISTARLELAEKQKALTSHIIIETRQAIGTFNFDVFPTALDAAGLQTANGTAGIQIDIANPSSAAINIRFHPGPEGEVGNALVVNGSRRTFFCGETPIEGNKLIGIYRAPGGEHFFIDHRGEIQFLAVSASVVPTREKLFLSNMRDCRFAADQFQAKVRSGKRAQLAGQKLSTRSDGLSSSLRDLLELLEETRALEAQLEVSGARFEVAIVDEASAEFSAEQRALLRKIKQEPQVWLTYAKNHDIASLTLCNLWLAASSAIHRGRLMLPPWFTRDPTQGDVISVEEYWKRLSSQSISIQ